MIDPWPQSSFVDPAVDMTNGLIALTVAKGDLVYTHVAGTDTFALGGKLKGGTVSWAHQ